MRSLSSWLLAGAAALPFTAPSIVHAEPYRFHFDHVLGTSLDVSAVAPDRASALMAVTAAKREIERLDGLLSAWREDGELAALNRGDTARVSPELFEVLNRCEAWRATTAGAFDCRVGGPLQVWRAAQAQAGGFEAVRLDRTLAAARGEATFDRETRTIRRPADMRFTLDGMAKGYVIDAALAAARRASPNLRGLMIDIGGDLRCWGQAAEAGGWRIGVAAADDADNASLDTVLRVNDCAVAASGRGGRDLRDGETTVSHTLDPATGRPVAGVRSAVVVARAAADADALSTAFMVMPPPQAMALANRLEGVEALVTDHDGVRHASQGWANLTQAPSPARLIRAAYAAPAPKELVLDLTYQVPKIDADPYHAPYIVMWLTDENRQLVRTLLVLGAKPKWAPENYVWWRRYGRQSPQVLDTVAKPTRPPGRYTARWDGKDEAGKPVAPGRYILHVEASREKGGHTYQTVDVDLTGKGGAKSLPAKDEMGALSLTFGG